MFISLPVYRSTIGETLPALNPSEYVRHTVRLRDPENGRAVTFILFVACAPSEDNNLNLAIRTYLEGRIFYGTIFVFRLSGRMSFRLINLRAGDRNLAMEAVARYAKSRRWRGVLLVDRPGVHRLLDDEYPESSAAMISSPN